MQKIVYIVGPTAVGKTNLAFDLANRYQGELVSADSVQVYKGLDIISGKDLPPDYKSHAGYYSSNSGSSIHLLDVVDPFTPFNVSDFQKCAVDTIALIHAKNKLPFVVGGTGLYVEVLLNGLEGSIGPDLKLRNKLETLSVEDLQLKLKKQNKEKFSTMNTSDVRNKRRLIRAIEITEGRLKINDSRLKNGKVRQFDCLVIGLMCDREILKQRINVRVEERIRNGALEEAKNLFENYETLAQQVKDANGYKQLFSYLKKELSWEECMYRWKISEYRHAKNQMTWFKKYGNVQWHDITSKTYKKDLESGLKIFLS
ncbi:MAG: tRNA (adenosine(37)-N6)-dimethylallyltransferase MiaA [Candidatus Levybacteria bacterium]|nr:tRNA (adenosine(37)-N6)-dimethylallyltransferase MiaA [Candidatus Levybacteria bacterium]